MKKVTGIISVLRQYLQYLLKARHRKGHGIHSPYVYELATMVILDKNNYSEYDLFRNIRKSLSVCDKKLYVENLGSKSGFFRSDERKVCDLVRRSSVSSKFGKLLYRLVRYYQPTTVIEMGTSVGLSTIYLASGNKKAKVITVEGNSALCDFAEKTFSENKITNIQVKHGRFDDLLNELSDDIIEPTLIFIDGNHQYRSTLHYFNFFSERIKEGLVVLDDIHWSHGMNKAWREINLRKENQACIDLFGMGIVILRPCITKQNYTIKF
jgi:predicted O-methyltransferase YrrM